MFFSFNIKKPGEFLLDINKCNTNYLQNPLLFLHGDNSRSTIFRILTFPPERDSATRFSTSSFYMDQFAQSPWLSWFEFFRKFSEIFAAQVAPPVSLTLVAN
jgi:hypothetical protein